MILNIDWTCKKSLLVYLLLLVELLFYSDSLFSHVVMVVRNLFLFVNLLLEPLLLFDELVGFISSLINSPIIALEVILEKVFLLMLRLKLYF